MNARPVRLPGRLANVQRHRHRSASLLIRDRRAAALELRDPAEDEREVFDRALVNQTLEIQHDRGVSAVARESCSRNDRGRGTGTWHVHDSRVRPVVYANEDEDEDVNEDRYRRRRQVNVADHDRVKVNAWIISRAFQFSSRGARRANAVDADSCPQPN